MKNIINVFELPYYRTITRMLLLLGIWPFQSIFQKIVKQIVVTVLVVSITVPQAIKFYEYRDNLEKMVQCVPMLGLFACSIVNFITWIFHQEAMKELAKNVEGDWNRLKDSRDVEILHDYNERGRRLTSLYAKLMYCLLALYMTSPATPFILDLVLPLNESRPRVFLYEMEYFVDQNQHYGKILLHAYCTVPVVVACIVFVDNLLAAFVHHACGMLEILKYKLENLQRHDATEHYDSALRLLTNCVDLQTNALDFIELVESSYNIALLLLIGINIAMITMTGFVILIKLDHPSEVLRIIAFNIGAAGHLFWFSLQGHVLAVQSESVFISTYQGQWYDLRPDLQRMLMLIMIRCQEPTTLTAGKIYVMSMESFSAVLRACLSFFTLLSSLR